MSKMMICENADSSDRCKSCNASYPHKKGNDCHIKRMLCDCKCIEVKTKGEGGK
jgi:hypothetical protein